MQQNVADYAKAIQAHLKTVVGVVPVYASFNRNWADEPKFVTWQLRNVHQEVYTGIYQNNKGIDRPVFQISVFAITMQECFELSNTIIQAMHGYTGMIGGTLPISKADVNMLYNSYDDTINLFSVFLDCTLDIPC